MNKPRIAVTMAFVTNGLATGSFMARIPDYMEMLKIDKQDFGLSLLCVSLGVLIGLNPAGRLSARYGSRSVVVPATLALAVAMFGVGLTFEYWQFCILLFFFGIVLAMQDVSMNAHAIAVEHAYNRKFMSTFHAMYSLGGFGGALVGGVFAQLSMSLPLNAFIVGLFSAIIALTFRNWWLNAEVDKHAIEHTQRKKRPNIFWILGLLGLCGQIGEGAAGDWGAVLAHEDYNATPFLSAMPYVVFSTTMIVGRLLGDTISTRYTPARILSTCGLLAGLGLATGLLIGGIHGQLLGWLALGSGLSIVIPVIFSASGTIAKERYPGTLAPSEGVAMVSGVAYAGFMAGPPIIGFVAHHTDSLWGAMFIPAALAIILGVVAPRVLK